MMNNIFYGNGGYGLDFTAASFGYNQWFWYNAWGSNNGGGTGLNYLNVVAGTGDLTAIANPFVSAGTANFALVPGSPLIGTAWPGAVGFGTGYASFGALAPKPGSPSTSAWGN